jgi:hypothetical protein
MKTYTVIYNSGTKVTFRASGFEFALYLSGRAEVKWTKIEPECIHFGLDDVAAIWEGKV